VLHFLCFFSDEDQDDVIMSNELRFFVKLNEGSISFVMVLMDASTDTCLGIFYTRDAVSLTQPTKTLHCIDVLNFID